MKNPYALYFRDLALATVVFGSLWVALFAARAGFFG